MHQIFLILCFLTPLLGRSASNSLAFLALSVCLVIITSKRRWSYVQWAAPFLAVLFGWVILVITQILGLEGLESLWSWNGVKGLYYWFSQPGLSEIAGLKYSLNIFTLVLVVIVVWEYRAQSKKIQRFILLGSLIASLVIIAEYCGLVSSFLPRRGNFWIHLERFSGTFKDPNSAGVFLSLLTPFVFSGLFSRIFKESIFGLIVLSAGLVTGSRTFMLAAIISFVLMFPSGRSKKILFAILGVTFLVLISWANLSPQSYRENVELLPQSGERLALMLVEKSGNESLESRSTFLDISMAMWRDHPIFGVGPGSFPSLVTTYSSSLGIDLKGWRDNSNNFYTGVAAELGVIGLIALIISILGIRPNKVSSKPELTACLLIPLLLLSGPHFNFIEVAILSGILIGLAIEPVTLGLVFRSRFIKLTSLIFLCAVVSFARFPQFGLFAPERDNKSEHWTSVTATWVQLCREGIGLVKFKVPQAADSKPVTITLAATHSETKQLTVTSNSDQQVVFRCDQEPLGIHLIVSPPWRPSSNSGSKDSRVLGVRILE